jgi:bifunctional UDP-N-acetylglucosamine pyrophosphorylase / glucosamine-1-phosphate N-acetyltransferase
MKNLNVLILAAGKGTRMVSDRAKVLHLVAGTPMVQHVYRAAAGLEIDRAIIVIGHDADRVRAAMTRFAVDFVLQPDQHGTGHAVMTAAAELSRLQGDLIVLFGDAPRIKTKTLKKMVEHHRATGAALTLLTATAEDPFGYGRILRDPERRISGIIEEKDATPDQRKMTEVNPGFYCFRLEHLLTSLKLLTNQNAQREYYITDLIGIEYRQGFRVETVTHDDFEELRGVNSRRELAELSDAFRRQKNLDLMAAGVTLIDPGRTYIDVEVAIEKDVTVYPLVTLERGTSIGEGSVLHSGTRISDSKIGRNVTVLDSCVITDSEIGDGTTAGPFARLRDHAVVGKKCRIGNFVEIKKSILGDGTKAAHLAYLGDATIGKDVNIGAGVITCNYDGVHKHATIIEDGAFVGTDSQLIAPVRIGQGAYVAAGSSITEDVPPEALGIARGRQTNKVGWAKRRKEVHD